MNFSLSLIQYVDLLEQNRKFTIGKQLLRSGTSIAANAMEAQNAESPSDFTHKMKIAAKEAEETQYWLWLCDNAANYPDCKMLIAKLEEIGKILSSILFKMKTK